MRARDPNNASPLPPGWRIFVTGITSIHGWPIFRQVQTHLPEQDLLGLRPPDTDRPALDNVVSFCITDRARLERVRRDFQPTHVIHCAGVCDLDVCEARPGWAHALNVRGAQAVTEIFGQHCSIIYMSTDLVFSGDHPPAGGYTEAHTPDPISVAGKTFAQAEEWIRQCPHHCIVRLGLPLGDSISGEKGAIDWIESRFRRNLPVTLFHDEFRSCVRCEAIGTAILAILIRSPRGLFHLGGDRTWSLYEIGQHVLQRGPYPAHLLTGRLRRQEENGPPRIGNVSLNSNRLKALLDL